MKACTWSCQTANLVSISYVSEKKSMFVLGAMIKHWWWMNSIIITHQLLSKDGKISGSSLVNVVVLRGTKFSNRGWGHGSWFFAICFSFRKYFNNAGRRKLLESVCAYFFNMIWKQEHPQSYFKTTKFARPHVVKYAMATCTF